MNNTTFSLDELNDVMIGLAHLRLYTVTKSESLKELRIKRFNEHIEPFENSYHKKNPVTSSDIVILYSNIPGGPLMRILRSIKFCLYNNDLDHFKELIEEAELCVSHMYNINEANNAD